MKKTTFIRRAMLALLLAPVLAFAQEEIQLDKAPVRNDPVELQNGAHTFVNYCLTCHGASAMRYNRLHDIGLTDAQIKDNLMFPTDKVGDTMKVALSSADGKKFFGTAPPDLSVIARSRGPDWLYSYLRSFYRDPARPSGWNNTVFPNVGMPHVLYEFQGERVVKAAAPAAAGGEAKEGEHEAEAPKMQFEMAKAGKLSTIEYDTMVADLVGFLVYVGEPAAEERKHLGYYVLFALFLLIVLTYALKREFWKDVH
jgi:ubiquinol-cytochrome c reductase cytochrome c1 subunit